MKYLDLFSGYGGFSLGIQQAYELSKMETKSKNSSNSESATSQYGKYPLCIGYSEIDKYAIQIYKKHFPTHRELGDITKLDPTTLPKFDLLCGGFPCQAFSIAGKRAGFEDTRGTLIYDVFRIVKEKHPKLVLLENVKGLLSHDNGRTFKTIITSLAELGYAVEWQVLNAKNFGVPQNRERVFIIGHLGGFGGRQVFPIGTGDSQHSDTDAQGNEIAYCLQAGGDKHRGSYIQSNKSGLRQIRELPDNPDGRGWKTYPADFRIRRLTPTECERLMGLPDGWTEGVSDTQRYKLCGNGVVVPVVRSIVSLFQ